jgi:hypothetical protein
MAHGHLITLSVAFVLAGGAAIAAEIELPPRRAPADVSMQKGPANCSRWTDECVNCSLAADGEPPVCSNIGFACQPQAIRCLSHAVPAGAARKK